MFEEIRKNLPQTLIKKEDVDFFPKYEDRSAWDNLLPEQKKEYVKNGEKYLFISISDVRYFPSDWYEHILMRTAKSDKDYRGGCNSFIHIDNFIFRAKVLFERWNYET